MVEKSRPPFVKHTIVIMIVFGVFFIGLLNIAFLLRLGDLSNPLIATVTAIYVAIDTALFVVAYGLWTMKPWARKAAIATIIAVIISGLPGLLALILFYRSLRNLFKSETKVAFGEKLAQREAEELKYKERKARRICEECGAKDVLLHELEKGKGFKLVCYECLKKAMESSTKGE